MTTRDRDNDVPQRAMTTNLDGGASEPVSSARPDPRAYLRILWRWRFLLVGFLVLIPLLTYVFESNRAKVYQTSALMEITGGQQTGVASLFNQVVQQGPDTTDLLAAARLVTTAGMAQEAAKFLSSPPADARSLLHNVTASADQNTGFITITGSAATPQRAAEVANAFAQAVVANQTETSIKQLNVAIDQLQRQLGTLPRGDPGRSQLAQQLARFRALRAAQNSNAQILDPATPSSSPVSPRVNRSVVLALIVAFLLGIGAVAIAETADRRIRHPDEVGDFTGLPLLSAIPETAFPARQADPEADESFATLRASLTYFNVDRRISSVLVTSPGKEDGKTTVAVRLGESLARAGKKVILLDADLRRPAVARRLGIPPGDGLGAVLVQELRLDDALLAQRDSNGRRGRLRVLPGGSPPPNPSELLGSSRMRDLIAELEGLCDIVIIDSTPLLTVSDSMPFVQAVSGVVLVARVNRTSRDAIARLREVIRSAGGNPLGVVATGAAGGGLYVAPGYGYETAYARQTHGNGTRGRRGRVWGSNKRGEAPQVGAQDAE